MVSKTMENKQPTILKTVKKNPFQSLVFTMNNGKAIEIKHVAVKNKTSNKDISKPSYKTKKSNLMNAASQRKKTLYQLGESKEFITYSNAGPPVWKFVDEIWKEKIIKKQEIYKKKFFESQLRKKEENRRKIVADHKKLMKLVGPKWFQELSPIQVETVESLKFDIIKDLNNKSTIHTKENLINFGLVRNLNNSYIQIALSSCSRCPIGFLLIFQKLISENSTTYSVDDRLLLSAVAHLTITGTLRELHVRIPSPPPPLPKPKIVEQTKPKQQQYKSPYLRPFDFVVCPRKHKAPYKNTQLLYPESPYFSYLLKLKEEKKFKSDLDRQTYLSKKQLGITIDQHQQILEEVETAQKMYNNLVDYEPVPYLLKPSLYICCDINFPVEETTIKVLEYGDTTPYTTNIKKSEQKKSSNSNVKKCVCMRLSKICNCSGNADLYLTELTVQKYKDKPESGNSPRRSKIANDQEKRVLQKISEEETTYTSSTQGTESTRRRYIILDKLPTEYGEQLNVLKKCLIEMAEDGYPLARFPQCWKLPIFRLWMQMRCRKYLTEEDKVQLKKKSIPMQNHTCNCKRRVRESAKLNISAEAAKKYTWANFKTVKNIVKQKRAAYYHQINEKSINEAREFFPTTYSYDIPNPRFRRCFFTYLPSSEAKCHYWKCWCSDEYKK